MEFNAKCQIKVEVYARILRNLMSASAVNLTCHLL